MFFIIFSWFGLLLSLVRFREFGFTIVVSNFHFQICTIRTKFTPGILVFLVEAKLPKFVCIASCLSHWHRKQREREKKKQCRRRIVMKQFFRCLKLLKIERQTHTKAKNIYNWYWNQKDREKKQKGNDSLFQWFAWNPASVNLVICDFWMVNAAEKKESETTIRNNKENI